MVFKTIIAPIVDVMERHISRRIQGKAWVRVKVRPMAIMVFHRTGVDVKVMSIVETRSWITVRVRIRFRARV